MKAITPWTEMVQAPFQTDGDLPSLEAGVNLAKIGDMQGAAETFQAAAKSAEMNPKVSPNTIAKAYSNLGLAYQYSDQYDKAMEAFKKSYTLDPSDATAKEIKNCENLRREKRKLDEHNQGAEKGK
jgi:tetratricopeptide (TPR) repeat protein